MKSSFNFFTKKFTWALLFVSLPALWAGCAREITESTDDIEWNLLRAYVQINYTNKGIPIDSTTSGLYTRTIVEGSGRSPIDSNYVYVNYITYDMSGNMSASGTNSDSLARQLGTFSHSIYYGPALWRIGTTSLYAGLEEALKKMKEGGKVRVLLPSWLSTINGARSLSSTTVFDIELLQVVPDIAAFQTDTLRAFSNRHYGGIDSTKYDFYYDGPMPASGDTLAYGDTLSVRYIGYLLDDFIFDTNIADTAVRYQIYDASKSYDIMSLVWAEEMEIIDGFKYALKNMRDGDEAITFFSSDHGYKSSGSGQIPAYAPLRFYLKVERVGRKATD